jgi:NAD+ synthase (glutamine-hydrolysing)
MRIALAQINATVGDIAGNERKLVDAIAAAKQAGAQIVAAPELALSGYPPEDLLFKEHFLAQAREALDRVAAHADGIVALVGFPERAEDVYNSAAICAGGEVQAIYRKMRLPNYGVFDEVRYFQAGSEPMIFDIDGTTVGVTICEDDWMPGTPATDEALAGARLIVNLSASPYHAGKRADRERMIAQRAKDNLVAFAFCALVGGQDELVFDGASFAVEHTGKVIARAPQFEERLLVCDVDTSAAGAARLKDTRPRLATRTSARPSVSHAGSFRTASAEATTPPHQEGETATPLDLVAEVYAALVLATHDYVVKNGFEHVVFGLSGGVDSALVALVACDALGPERVTAVVMPSRYSSTGTQGDARRLAQNLGIACLDLPIEQPMIAGGISGAPVAAIATSLRCRVSA